MKKVFLLILAMVTMSVARATITPTESQMWWGYFCEADASSNGTTGYNQAGTIDAAIYVPANEELVGGSTIKAVRFWLGNDVTTISSDLTIWISTTQPSSATTNCTYKQTVAKSSLAAGVNEVVLTTPYVVNNQGFYIGYSFSTSSTAYPIVAEGIEMDHSFYYRVNNGSWENFYGLDYGNLALQILIDGGNYPNNAAIPIDFGQIVSFAGKDVSIPIIIINKGKNPITSFSYTVTTVGGSTTAEETQTIYNYLPFNGYRTLEASIPGENVASKKQKIITITKVNGVANEATNKTVSGNVITITEKVPVTPVVEEFTGTWCGYCPSGLAGMKKLHDTFGNQVTLIAVHGGDPMDIGSYSPIIDTFADGFPSSVIDRHESVYPNGNWLKSSVNEAFNKAAQGIIELTAQWKDNDKTAVIFNTNTTFVYDENNGQYGIAYVLVEDGLTGNGNRWSQTNFLTGQSGDSDMQFWFQAGSSVSGIEYDHVAVAAWDILNGVNGSVSSTIVNGQAQKYSYVGDISANELIQNKSKLKAVVLLIDRTSGYIVNSAQATIADCQADVTLSKNMTTYADNRALDFSAPIAGLKAYVVSAVTNNKAVLTEVTGIVPAGTGLILKGTAGQSYVIPCVADNGGTVTNKLVGVTTDTTIGGNNFDYILKDGKFVKATQGTISAGKAYLRLDAAPSREMFDIVYDTTDINDINTYESAGNRSIYNLSGQRVNKPANGLYVIDGKKVLIK